MGHTSYHVWSITLIPVGAGSPIIFAKNGQSHKPAPAIYYGRSIGHDITTLENRYITRRAQVKTNIEDGNLVYLPNGQAAKSGLNKSMLDAAHGQFTTVIKYVAGKLGKSVVFVDPKGSSQHWWNCLNKVPKEL